MKRKLLISIFVALWSVTGCGLVEFGLSDISGWDFSACGESFDSFGVCFEVFSDNEEKILGGQTLVETLLGGVAP